MLESYEKAVQKVYESLDSCIIIGLTGRTGSGCTTTAKILETKNFKELPLKTPKKSEFCDIEERKTAVVYNFLQNNWTPFISIEVSSVILSYVFEKGFEKFVDFIKKLVKPNESKNFSINGYEDLMKKIDGLSYLFKDTLEIDEKIDENNCEKYFNYFIKTIKKRKKEFMKIFSKFSCYESPKSRFTKSEEKKSQLYTYLLQMFGNNIRSSKDPYDDSFNGENFDEVAKRIINIIRIIQIYNQKTATANDIKTRICIDAIRNPYEAYCLKDCFKTFYLVSVNTDDDERRRRLNEFDESELKSMDDMEYPVDFESGKIFFQQSIAECLQISDIHLYNPYSSTKTYEFLTQNLVRYIALMLHPGLVTPNNEERCMQVAYNAKFNSGCLSRQVGAAITDENYYVKAIGWNEVPHGQVPCALRSIDNYFSERDKYTFSKFELENCNFRNALKNLKNNYECCQSKSNIYNLPYCFKDIYNGIEKNKNQVHTRSLHAEENAFLQASKFGGTGIQGGKLFVTASPCELCSKKSYQLGIKDIYYIDPYPGIASSHVLTLGDKKTNPKLHIFRGAIGSAYVSLYMQRFAIKDELQLVSGVKVKDSIFQKPTDYRRTYNEVDYKNMNLELIMNNRFDLEFIQEATFVPSVDRIEKITKQISWTGSTYIKTEPNEDRPNYFIIEEASNDNSNRFSIKPNEPYKKHKEYSYNVKTFVKDSLNTMSPLLACHIRFKIDCLTLTVKFRKSSFEKKPKKFYLKKYANMYDNILFDDTLLELNEEDSEYYIVNATIEKPYLLYTYAIEWEF